MKYGDLIPAGYGSAIVIADFDFETRGDAGYLYIPPAPPTIVTTKRGTRIKTNLAKWKSLPGYSEQAQSRGLPAVGARVYAEHYSFSPLMLAYDLKDGNGRLQWVLGMDFYILGPLFDHIRAGKLIEAHNAAFERTVWNTFCVPVWGWPTLHIEQQRCSAAKCRAFGYPGKLAEVTALLPVTQKDGAGKELIKLFTEPKNPTKKDLRTHVMPREAPTEWAQFMAYNVTDIVAESEVSALVPDLPAIEQEYWFMDQYINDRGMAVDLVNVGHCIALIEQIYAKFGAEMRELTGGIKASELEQLKAWCALWGVHMPDMTAKTISAQVEALEGDTLRSESESRVLRVLQLRQMLDSASVKKLFALLHRAARDRRIHEMYMYHATHHGRTGGYGVQPANLVKGDWHTPEEIEHALAVIATRSLAAVEAAFPDIAPMRVIENVLRSLFVAAPGKTLISSDYSAIEAVCLACLSGEQWVIDVLRTHGMIYEATISRMTGIPFADFVKHRVDTGGTAYYAEDGTLLRIEKGKHHPMRQQGKLADLSGGYASWLGGWKKFGADKYYADDAEMKQAILAYRDARPNTVELWGGQTRDKFKWNERPERYGLEGAAIDAVENPGTAYTVGLISFEMDAAGDVLYMRLPSGRLIAYHTPRLAPATRPYASDWELALTYWGWNTNPDKGPPAWVQMDLYGGVLTQNACGGTARDIMMHGMTNVTRLGYPIVMHTYDEAVAEIPEGTGNVDEFEAGLNDLPEYARGWPIFARGGWMGGRYGKWD